MTVPGKLVVVGETELTGRVTVNDLAVKSSLVVSGEAVLSRCVLLFAL